MVEADQLFARLGYELEVFEVVAARGGEIVHDLNEPLPERYRERYAVVLDAGTLEHCFNIAQAARSVAEMVARGGAAIHGNPVNMYNHGFYNLNPTWYHDFYAHNGFEIELMRLVVDTVRNPRLAEAPPHARFHGVPEDTTILVVARRAEIRPVAWPVQRKYRDNPTLRG